MKVAIIIIGILGALASLFLGIKWLADFDQYGMLSAGLGEEFMSELKNLKIAAYLLIAFGIIGIAASAMVGKLKKITGIVLLAGALLPVFFSFDALLATFLMLVAGIMALFYKGKKQLVAA